MLEMVVSAACALPVGFALLVLRRREAIKRVAAPTFVFADLVGYTALTERVGDQAAADLAREFRRTMRRTDLLPVRAGVHTGPAARRGCDWYGSTVNVAARLAGQAEPNEALISAATRVAAHERLDASLSARRDLALRGMDGRISAWRLA